MQLRRVAFQCGGQLGDEPFSEVYREMFLAGENDDFTPRAQAIFDLLLFLEQNIYAPPQWIMTSVDSLHFKSADQTRYGEITSPKQRTHLYVRCSLYPLSYEIHINLLAHRQTVRHALTIKEAAQIIEEVLRQSQD